MSFPRYPKYKDSGVEWLGQVPEHWDLKRFKRIFKERELRSFGGKETLLSVSAYTGVTPRSDVIDDGDYLSRAESLEGYKICYKDDLVMNIMLAWNRGLAFTMHDGIVSPAYCVFFVIDGSEPRFLNYLVRSDEYNLYFKAFSSGVIDSRLRIYPDTFGRLFCGLPPLPEQTAIASFLDQETAKIDDLVSEQQRLIELLKEKRQAVISHAVTKGLNPKAPMKSSGIEWLGDVPEHWEVPYFGVLIGKAELGANHDSSEGNEGIPVMKMGNLDRGFVKLHKVEFLPESVKVSESMLLKQGDFLFNTRNSLDLVGKVAIWRGELAQATYNSNILRIAFNSLKVATSAYMNYFFNSDLGLSQLRSLAKGTTSVAAIYSKDLTALRVVLPPSDAQLAIVAHLDEACANLDALTTEAQRGIDLLQERRTALISAAVTGQIDVRPLTGKKSV